MCTRRKHLDLIPRSHPSSDPDPSNFMLRGGPGDALGRSGRARGRLLRPARGPGRDGRKGRHANARGWEGVKEGGMVHVAFMVPFPRERQTIPPSVPRHLHFPSRPCLAAFVYPAPFVCCSASALQSIILLSDVQMWAVKSSAPSCSGWCVVCRQVASPAFLLSVGNAAPRFLLDLALLGLPLLPAREPPPPPP